MSKVKMVGKNVEIILKNVRLSFAHVFVPQERKDDKTGEITGYNYSINALLDKVKDKEQIALVREGMKLAKSARWPGDNSPRIPPERLCLRDGEPINEDIGEREGLYDGYSGAMFVSANKGVRDEDDDNPVQLLGPKRTAKDKSGKPCFPELKERDGLLYSGAYANVIIRIYGYDGKGKNPNRINASLEAVQFVRHGESFGAAPIDANSVLDEVDGDDDDLDIGGTTSNAPDDDFGI